MADAGAQRKSRPGYELSSCQLIPISIGEAEITPGSSLPLLQVAEGINEKVKINGLRTVKVIFICMRFGVFLGSQSLVERILADCMLGPAHAVKQHVFETRTITRITTQGRFSDLTISMATEVLPDPELPAMPMMLRSCHGGEYLTSVESE